MKILKNFWKVSLSLMLAASIIGCGGEKKEVNNDEIHDEIAEEATEDDDSDDYAFVLPSALQTASIFKRSGLTYQGGVTNEVENISKYSSKISKMMNFGVYSADLSYCILNDHAQDGMKYMKVVKQLSEELGMTGIFGSSSSLFESFENNIGNEDSMIYILASVQEAMDDYIEDNEKQYMQVVIFAGAWTEGMYIGSKVATDKESRLAKRLVEQMVILENVIKGLEHFPRIFRSIISLHSRFQRNKRYVR